MCVLWLFLFIQKSVKSFVACQVEVVCEIPLFCKRSCARPTGCCFNDCLHEYACDIRNTLTVLVADCACRPSFVERRSDKPVCRLVETTTWGSLRNSRICISFVYCSFTKKPVFFFRAESRCRCEEPISGGILLCWCCDVKCAFLLNFVHFLMSHNKN